MNLVDILEKRYNADDKNREKVKVDRNPKGYKGYNWERVADRQELTGAMSEIESKCQRGRQMIRSVPVFSNCRNRFKNI